MLSRTYDAPEFLHAGTEADADRPGGKGWRDKCAVLYRMWQRDQRDFEDALRAEFKDTWKSHTKRVVPVVWKAAVELCTSYIRPVLRTVKGPDGEPVSGKVQESFEQAWRQAEVNGAMQAGHEVLVACCNQPILAWPTPDARNPGFRLVAGAPHEYEFRLKPDALFGHSVGDLEEMFVRLPASRRSTGTIIYGVARITPTEAHWVGGGGVDEKGLWEDDGSNPIGKVPLVMLRSSKPSPGDWFAPIPEDLWLAAQAINLGFTDLGHVTKTQGYGQAYISGMPNEQVKELKQGPERLIGLPTGATLGFAQPKADISGSLAQLEAYIRAVAISNGMNPAAFQKSSGITAQAKIVELADREAIREKHRAILMTAEQDIYDIGRLWVNYLRGNEVLPEGATVAVEYREKTISVDPLHDAQARALDYASGVRSIVRDVASFEGMTREEAKARIRENVAEMKELGFVPATSLKGTPG